MKNYLRALWVMLSRVLLPLRREPTAWEKFVEKWGEALHSLRQVFISLGFSTKDATTAFSMFGKALEKTWEKEGNSNGSKLADGSYEE